MLRLEPGPAQWEARTLLLCYALFPLLNQPLPDFQFQVLLPALGLGQRLVVGGVAADAPLASAVTLVCVLATLHLEN